MVNYFILRKKKNQFFDNEEAWLSSFIYAPSHKKLRKEVEKTTKNWWKWVQKKDKFKKI